MVHFTIFEEYCKTLKKPLLVEITHLGGRIRIFNDNISRYICFKDQNAGVHL